MREEIKVFIELLGAESYLEIGLGDGKNFASVPLEDKYCFSPNGRVSSGTLVKEPSDLAFDLNYDLIFDIVFIDGLHEYTQVVRDVNNATERLKEDGVILIHDVNPTHKNDSVYQKTKPPGGGAWCGDVWKIIPHIVTQLPEYDFRIIEGFPGMLVMWLGRGRDVSSLVGPTPYEKKSRENFTYTTVTLREAVNDYRNSRNM